MCGTRMQVHVDLDIIETGIGVSVHISAGPGIDVTYTLTDTTDCYNPCTCALRVNNLSL